MSSAVFDRIRTCDNHCAFCFIYQLPKGMRKSLYLKDDDYRLSFLYGNFTTLTRFTELDAERILTERLGPLFVSIHSTDPELRAHMLRNPKGATSLRWLSVLLDGGIEVHGQVVVCPGVNDAMALEDTLAGVLDQYPALATLGVVPLGISQFSNEAEMRAHTTEEAAFVVDTVAEWQAIYTRTLGRRLVYAADEYYLLADRPFPAASAYDEFPQHENGIGMARAFVDSFANPGNSGPGGRAPRVLRLRRCRAGRGLPGHPPGADRSRVDPGLARDGRPPAGHRAHRDLRRPDSAAAAGGPPPPRRGGAGGGQRLLRRQYRRGRVAHGRGPRPRPGRRPRGAPATCCPTPASTRAASSTA